MASRDRTPLFLQYRSSTYRPQTKSTFFNTHEEDRLVGESDQHTIELSVLPPQWTTIVADIEDKLHVVESKLDELSRLYRKNLIPNFEKDGAEDEAITQASASVTQLISECHSDIKKIQRYTIAPDLDAKIVHNVQSGLAGKVQELSQRFRNSQNTYLHKLKKISPKTDFSLEDGEAEAEMQEFMQVQDAYQNEGLIAAREAEMIQLGQSMETLAQIFQEMGAMVVEQGSLLDRIDFNVENTATNLTRANEELDAGAKYQRSTTKKKIIFLLLLTVLALIIFLIARR